MSDIHYKGEFASIKDAWKKYPNGGGFGDYIIVDGDRVDWNEYTHSWGEQEELEGEVRPSTEFPHGINVRGEGNFEDGVSVGEHIDGVSGAAIDKDGNADFRSVNIDSLFIKHSGETIPLAEYIKIFKTELPPDWEEYVNAPLFNTMRLLVFDPVSNSKYYTTIKAIKDVIGSGGGEGGSGGVDIVVLRSDDDESTPTDNNVLSALRTLLEIKNRALSKLDDDTAHGVITALKGMIFGEFIPGMFGGTGAKIDEHGNIEAASLVLRALLEVPELRYNRLTVIGDELIFTESGVVKSVEHLGGRAYRLHMKLEEGDSISFLANDLVKGIFHHDTGFATSYLIVNEVKQLHMDVSLAENADVPSPYNAPPKDFMNIARVGHAGDNKNRQRYIVVSSKLGGIQVFDGATTFLNGRLAGSMDIAQSFKNLYGDLPLKPGLFYLYAAGLVVQDIIRVDYQGVPVREVYDRGPWDPEREYFNNDEQGTDDTWHYGCRWRCFSSSTMEEPRWDSAAWVMIEGNPYFELDFAENEVLFDPDKFNTTLTIVASLYNRDITADILNQDVEWSRYSEDANGIERVASDHAWNIRRHNSGKVLNLTGEDADFNGYIPLKLRFTATVTLRDGMSKQISFEYI